MKCSPGWLVRSFVLRAMVAVLLGLAVPASAQFAIDWWTVDGGGGASSGGNYALSGTIGQPDAGSMSGGTFILQGGFWANELAPPSEPLPRLSIQLRPNGICLLSWPYPSTGFLLMVNSDLTKAKWDPVEIPPVRVGEDYQVEVVSPIGQNFYLLRKP